MLIGDGKDKVRREWACYTDGSSVRSAKHFLNQLGSKNTIQLNWIRAHVIWKYNEVADENAQKGIDEAINPENIPAKSRRSIYSIVEDKILKEWVQHWERAPGCRQSRYFLIDHSKTIALLLLRQNREALGRMVRFLTGHTYRPSSSFEWRGSSSIECEFGSLIHDV